MYLMIYSKHMLMSSIWSGSTSFNFDGVSSLSWNFLMTFMYTKLIKSFTLPPSRKSRIFSPACNISLLSDANEKILNRFRNFRFFRSFCNTVRDPRECNLHVIWQPQKLCIARFDCVSSSPSNCLDFLISTVVLMELEYKCTGWWSDGF